MDLRTATWTDADAADADCLCLPVGSTEQHGPHAPLATDALTAAAVADRAAAADDALVVGPTVPVGVSAEHRAFAGTLAVSADTFRAYVRETVESGAAHGWDRAVLVNGHGGNAPALREVAARLTREGTARTAAFTWFDAVDADDMGHGGPVETSALLSVRADLVREDRLDDAARGAAERWGRWVGGTNLAYDVDEFAANGVVGDPREASAERGEQLLDAAAGALLDVVGALRGD
ncbi:MAG: creatininase family protein [Halobacteriaceae archaeon]